VLFVLLEINIVSGAIVNFIISSGNWRNVIGFR